MPMLAASLTAWGAEVRPMAVVGDDLLSMRAALRGAVEHSNLLLTTAGISIGDEDDVRDALQTLGGDLIVLKVAMKPGKPRAAGRLGRAVFKGLTAHPRAALAGALGFVRPLLARMTGGAPPRPLRAYAGFDMRRKAGRAEFIPVGLVESGAGLWAEQTGPETVPGGWRHSCKRLALPTFQTARSSSQSDICSMSHRSMFPPTSGVDSRGPRNSAAFAGGTRRCFVNVFSVVGSCAVKTEVVRGLVAEFVGRGVHVSTVKCVPETVDLESPEAAPGSTARPVPRR
jgi:hypothetical protein